MGIAGCTHCPFGGSQKELLQAFPFYGYITRAPPQTPSRQEHQQLLCSSGTWSSNDHLLSTARAQVCYLNPITGILVQLSRVDGFTKKR